MEWIKNVLSAFMESREGGYVPQEEMESRLQRGFDEEQFVLYSVGMVKAFRQYNCLVVRYQILNKEISNTIILN